MRFCIVFAVLQVMWFFVPARVNAELAPRIENATGTLVEEGVLTITGQNFGVKAQAAPIFFDKIDSVCINGQKSVPYQNVLDGVVVPTGIGWPWRGQVEDFVRIARSGEHYGNRSSHYRVIIDQVSIDGSAQSAWLDFPSGFPDPVGRETKKLYLSWYIKLSFDPASQSGSHKFVRIWDVTSGNPVGIRISWTQMHLTYDQDGVGQKPSWKTWGGEINKWNKMELYIDTDTGVIKAWTNGVLMHDIRDFVPGGFNATGDFQGIRPRLWGLDGSGDANFQNGVVELSDYWADSTQARVEICSESKWPECVVRESQPAISWTQNEIKVSLNVGNLANLDSAYIYVVKESGVHNFIGYPLADVVRPSSPNLD